MCKSNFEIQFCACELKKPEVKINPELEKEDYYKTRLIWTLRTYHGKMDSGMMG